MSRNKDDNTKHPEAAEADEPRIAGQVMAALRSLGWTIPRTQEQVATAERELAAGGAALPEVPPEMPDVADGPSRLQPPAGLGHASDIDAALARAAREAGTITPEIEQQMRRDRQAAEEQADRQAKPEGHDGQDVR